MFIRVVASGAARWLFQGLNPSGERLQRCLECRDLGLQGLDMLLDDVGVHINKGHTWSFLTPKRRLGAGAGQGAQLGGKQLLFPTQAFLVLTIGLEAYHLLLLVSVLEPRNLSSNLPLSFLYLGLLSP
jgi:hypothetical protein